MLPKVSESGTGSVAASRSEITSLSSAPCMAPVVPLCTCSSSVPTDSLATSSLVAYYVLARTLFFSFLFGRKMMYITWHLKIRELYKTKREIERGEHPFRRFQLYKTKRQTRAVPNKTLQRFQRKI
jgi:hypothetical protein